MFIIVLGGGIDLAGNLPNHVYQRLDKAFELYNNFSTFLGANPGGRETLARIQKNNFFFVVSGKYSFLYDQLKKYPPMTEAEKMAKYLEEKGIPKDQILVEKKSQDTISNAYYLKKDIFLPYGEKQAIIVTNRFHIPRVRYIFQKVFGHEYSLKFVGADQQLTPVEEKRLIEYQRDLLNQIKNILSPMKDGNHTFLDGKFYTIDYYRKKRPDWVIKFVAEGK